MDDLLPAELALPPGAPAPIPDHLLERAGDGLPAVEYPALANRDEAEWVMRRLAGLVRFVEQQRGQRDVWKARVDDWYEEVAGPAERRVIYLEEVLQRYAIAERVRNPRQATVKVPSGDVWTRAGKEPRVVIDNETELLAYLAESLSPEQWDAVVRTTQAVRVSELGKIVEVIEREVPPPDEWEGNVPADYDERELVVLFGGERVPGVHAEPPTTTSGVRPSAAVPALDE